MEQKEKAKDEEKYKENKTNFEGTYLGDGWADSTQIWNRRYLTPMEFLLVDFRSGTIELRMRENRIS